MGKFCASRCDKNTDGAAEAKAAAAEARKKIGVIDRSVADILADLNFCPFVKLAELAKTARSEYIQAQAAAELAKYTKPQLKSIEHKGNQQEPVNLVINI